MCWSLGWDQGHDWACSKLCLLQYSGIWYPKAMIHNGSLPSHKIPSKVFPVKVTALEGGDMEAHVTFWYVSPTVGLHSCLSPP